MNFSLSFNRIGIRIASGVLITAVLVATGTSSAQEDQAAAPFDNEVLTLLLESRIQKSASEATPQEIQSAVEELMNIYAISDLPHAIELGNDPRIKAQIELQRRAILFNAFATDFLATNPATEEEIFDLYAEQVAIAPPKEFKARHILVETQSEAQAVVDELQNGADFAELAMEHSTGPSGPAGGDLGWFTAQAMVEPFSDAVAVLEDGDFTAEPVQTQFGWHVILREDSRDSAPPPLESVRDVLKQRVEQQKLQDFMVNLRSNDAE